MFSKILHLFKSELLNNFYGQNGVFFNSLLSILLVSMIGFILPEESAKDYSIGIYLLFLIIKSIFFTDNYLRYKHKYGILEYMLCCYESSEIIIAGFGFIATLLLSAAFPTVIALKLMYNFPSNSFLYIISGITPFILQISSLSLLMSFIGLYLENGLNLILFIILPLMIPGLILTTISLDLYSSALVLKPIYLINLGSSLVLMGVCLSLCSIIAKSIYNTEN